MNVDCLWQSFVAKGNTADDQSEHTILKQSI
uniref:Uncharacterized protein n=1 Tax=Anguilla anguilla TaxID=7936 RepID=A0A0E9RM19_ANGAN